jgi:concanavalin A-like lectin/glucanase superfamily protein
MALRASGTSQYGIRTAGGFFPLTAFTACFWINLETDKNASGAAFGLRLNSDYIYYYNPNSDGQTYGWEVSVNGVQLDLTALTLNTWYFVALSKSGNGAGQATAYKRTASQSTLTSVSGDFNLGVTPTEETVLGNGFDTTNGYFPGRIAGLKQWSVALTADELLAESQQILPVRYADLHSFRPFHANAVAGAVIDYGGAGRSLTANGALSVADGPPVAWRQGRRSIFLPQAAGGGATVDLDGLVGGRASAQGALSIVRALSGKAAGQGRIVAPASALRPLAGNVAGRGRASGGTSIARALVGRVAGCSSVQGAAGALRSLGSAIAGRSNVIAGIGTSAVVALTGWITGRSSVQGALSIARNLSGRIGSQSGGRGAASIVRNLTARVSGRATARSAASALRSLSSIIRARSTVKASFPPIFEEVVGIVRVLLRASMEALGLQASMSGAPVRASGKIRTPIVVNATNMIAKNVTLKDYVIGDDTEIAFELTDWPAGVVLAKAYFTVKRSLDDADIAAVIQREITVSLSAEGQITANGSSGTATGYFLIRHQDAEWANIRPRTPYAFDIQPITDQATVQTPIIGTISFQKGATDATS